MWFASHLSMQSEWFIARRLFFSEDSTGRMSRPAIRVALTAIIIGVVVMIVSLFVIAGFKKEVSRKVVGFQSHIQVVNFENNNTFELTPIRYDSTLLRLITQTKGVSAAQPFITKPGIIKTADNFHGIVLKGEPLPSDDNPDFWEFFSHNIDRGRLPEKSNEVILSSMLARQLSLDLDSSFLCYFVGKDIRVRKYTISGLYTTGLSEADDMFVIGDIDGLRQLNAFSNDQASGIDILINERNDIFRIYDELYINIVNRFDDDGNAYYLNNIIDNNPNIFKWLDLLDKNVLIIILLMLAVSIANITTSLIIIIMDSIRLIGTLKSLGSCNKFVSRIFFIEGGLLVAKGMVWGNLIGLTLCALQYAFHIIPLDPQSYYVDFVPIAFDWGWWLLLNIFILTVIMLTLILPSRFVSRISPAEVMRYE